MRNRIPNWFPLVYTMLLAVVMVTGCPASSAPSRSPLEVAKIAYVDASYVYDSANDFIQTARAAGHVTDAQFARIQNDREQVRFLAPIIRRGLDAWAATGAKPADFDANYFKLLVAFDDVNIVKGQVKP